MSIQIFCQYFIHTCVNFYQKILITLTIFINFTLGEKNVGNTLGQIEIVRIHRFRFNYSYRQDSVKMKQKNERNVANRTGMQ